MGKSNTLTAMLFGAALAGGYMYLKKMNEQQGNPSVDSVDDELNDLKRDHMGEERGWHPTYTINGEEVSAEEMKTYIKAETTKAVEKFRADAKVASEEILTGLKKAIADMKVAVDGARKAAAERRAAAETENSEEECCCQEQADKECCCQEQADKECCCQEEADKECCCQEEDVTA